MARSPMAAPDAPPHDDRLLTASVVAAGLLLRVRGFTHPWLNPDEGIYFQLAFARTGAHFFDGILNNAHPPLQYMLLRALGSVSDDFSWLRAPSLLAGTLAIYVMIRLGREAVDRRTGLLAGAALAFAPGAILLSQVMRPYALLLLLLTTAAWYALRAVRTGTGRDLAVHSVALGLALCTHYAAYLAAPAFGLLLLGDAARRDRAPRQRWQRAAAQAGLLAVAGGAYWLHLRPVLIGGALHREAQNGWLAAYMPEGPLDAWLGFVGVQRYLFGAALEAPAVLLFVLGLGWLVTSGRGRLAWLSSGVVAAAVVAGLLHALPLGSTRHSSALAAFTLPVMAAPIAGLWARGGRFVLPAALLIAAAGASPAVTRSWIGAEGLNTRAPVEHVASARSIRAALDRIVPWTQTPTLIVMDRQTFSFLAPVLHPLSSPDRHGRGPVLAGFRWGRADVIVSQSWMLRVDARGRDAPDHLDRFLSQAQRALPQLEIEHRREGALVLGGWNAERYTAFERAAPAGAIRDWNATPGLVTARVDWSQVRRATPSAETAPESQ